MERVSEEKNHNEGSQLKRYSLEIIAIEWSGAINIPLDLKVEILKKLPVKSLLRFQCVSKQWSSIISTRKDFIDCIVTRSLAHSQRDYHFIFYNSLFSSKPFFLFSSTYPEETTREVPIIQVIQSQKEFQYVRGLIGYWSSCFGRFTIHNPTTRQSHSLKHIPTCELLPRVQRNYLFGYDTNENQYKVVCLPDYFFGHSCHVFTLGDPTKQWRIIQCSVLAHFPLPSAVFINGTIYYKGMTGKWNEQICVLVSFDVRFETFNHVQTPQELSDLKDWTLVNYQGKLGLCCNYSNKDVYMWVMEDAAKEEWSKITLFSRYHLSLNPYNIRCLGFTPGGEMVLIKRSDYKDRDSNAPLYVYYYDPKQDTFRRVGIDLTSLGNIRPSNPLGIWAVPVHVENTMCL